MSDASIIYERRYAQCREQGLTGWFDGTYLADILASLSHRMRAEHIPNTGRVLELGCGAGDQSLLLAEMSYDLIGVDISPTAVAWAQEKAALRGSNARFQVGDVCNLDGIASDSIDIAVDGMCLHFIVGERRQALLANALRVLRRDGWLLVTSICSTPDDEVTAPGYDPDTRCYYQGGVAITYQGLANDISHEIETSGFEIVWQDIQPGTPGKHAAVLRIDAKRA